MSNAVFLLLLSLVVIWFISVCKWQPEESRNKQEEPEDSRNKQEEPEDSRNKQEPFLKPGDPLYEKFMELQDSIIPKDFYRVNGDLAIKARLWVACNHQDSSVQNKNYIDERFQEYKEAAYRCPEFFERNDVVKFVIARALIDEYPLTDKKNIYDIAKIDDDYLEWEEGGWKNVALSYYIADIAGERYGNENITKSRFHSIRKEISKPIYYMPYLENLSEEEINHYRLT